MTMKNPRVARRYARALMTVAEERDAVDSTSESMAMISRVLGSSRELRLLLASPIVPESRKASIVRELFQGRAGDLAMAFVELLVRKHREVHLAEVDGLAADVNVTRRKVEEPHPRLELAHVRHRVVL